MKALKRAFIIFGLLGFITLIPGVMDKFIYSYFRFANGSVMNLGGKCYDVPVNWVIDSREGHGNDVIFNLRSKVDDEYIFSSVLRKDKSSIPGFSDLRPVNSTDGIAVYELVGLPAEVSVRYWAYVSEQNLLIMGRSIPVLESLAHSIKSVVC